MPSRQQRNQTESLPIPFVGTGTILCTDIIRINTFPSNCGSLEMLDLLRRHQDYSFSIIQAHRGEISQFIGSATIAYWYEQQHGALHAASAFATAQQMLAGLPGLLSQQSGAQYDIRVTLGTGALAGEFFGPVKQFQVVGQARAIADRLERAPGSAGSAVRLSQYTADLLEDAGHLVGIGRITREGLADLQILEWRK